MVVIKHETPDLRRHVRRHTSIEVQIKDVVYAVADWSLGGFRIDDFLVESLEVGDRFAAKLILQCHGLEVSFTKEVEVVRLAGEASMAARFLDLTARDKELFELAVAPETRNGEVPHLLSGNRPMTPTSSMPTPREAPLPSRLGLALRRAFFTLFYWAIGLALGGVIVVTCYWSMFRMDLEYSVLSQPLYPVISQDLGRCQAVFVTEGETVMAGQPLFRVEDDVLTRDLELAQMQLAVTKVDLQTAEARVLKEKEKLALSSGFIQTKHKRALAQVANLNAQVITVRTQLNRLRLLLSQTSTSREEVERLEMLLSTLEVSLVGEKAELQIAEQAVEALKHGNYYDGRRLVGDLQQYQINLDDARDRHRVAGERVKLAQERVKRLTYHAPFDGKVVKLLNVVGGTMNRGEVLAILEKASEEMVIDCFVTQDEANNLTLGTRASIRIPALDKTYWGEVLKIDRTSGFVTEMQDQLKDSPVRYNRRGPQDHSAHVQVAITDNLSAEDRKELAGGTPVIVSVSRTPPIWYRIQSLFK